MLGLFPASEPPRRYASDLKGQSKDNVYAGKPAVVGYSGSVGMHDVTKTKRLETIGGNNRRSRITASSLFSNCVNVDVVICSFCSLVSGVRSLFSLVSRNAMQNCRNSLYEEG